MDRSSIGLSGMRFLRLKFLVHMRTVCGILLGTQLAIYLAAVAMIILQDFGAEIGLEIKPAINSMVFMPKDMGIRISFSPDEQ